MDVVKSPIIPKAFFQTFLKELYNNSYLQPTRAALLAERGQQGYFHYNAIVSWQVQPDGAVRHIYIGDTAATPHGAADPFDAPWQ